MKLKKMGMALVIVGIAALSSCRSDTDNYVFRDGIGYVLLDDGTYEVTVECDYKEDTFTVPRYLGKRIVSTLADQSLLNQKKIKHVILHEDIITISKNAFWGSGLMELEILPTVLTIGDYAFYDCDSLTEITIPSTVLSVGNCMFVNCDNLVTVNYPERFTSIPWGMFDSCTSLTNFTISSKVTEIGGYAFRGNPMEELTIPGNVKTVGNSAYKACPNLKTVTIEEGVETLGREVFKDSANLKNVSLPSTLKSIDKDALLGNALEITYNGTKESFERLNVNLSKGTKITCIDGSIEI